MVVLEFTKVLQKSTQAERDEADEAFRKILAKEGTPIFTAMGYSHYVKTDQWDEDVK